MSARIARKATTFAVRYEISGVERIPTNFGGRELIPDSATVLVRVGIDSPAECAEVQISGLRIKPDGTASVLSTTTVWSQHIYNQWPQLAYDLAHYAVRDVESGAVIADGRP